MYRVDDFNYQEPGVIYTGLGPLQPFKTGHGSRRRRDSGLASVGYATFRERIDASRMNQSLTRL